MVLISIAFSGTGIWLIKHSYIDPFFIYDKSKILADSWLIMPFFLSASAGFFIMLPFNVASVIFRGRDLKIKTIAIFMCIFGVFGFLGNIALYQYVIKPKEMIICPREFGYKKNLMRFYVTDLSLCKSD